VVGQIYSGKRQALHNVNQVVQKMKSGDFDDHILLGKCTEIIANEHLEEPTGGEKVRYQKTSEGDFKRLEKNSSIDLVMQKFHYQPKEDKDIKFLAWKIVDTTDKTLKKFVNQALLQKVDQKQQALTKPDDIINYMLDNYDG